LAEKGLGMFLPNEVEQVPRTVGKNDAMDFSVVLNRVEEIVKSVAWTSLCDHSEEAFRFIHGLAMNGVPNGFSTGAAFSELSGFDSVKHFVFASAFLLDAIGVAIEDFENRQGLHGSGQFTSHVERWRKGHHRVKADVIFAAKSAGVGQGARSDETPKLGARFHFLSQRGQQFIHWRFLQETNERFKRTELESVRGIGSKCRRKPEFVGSSVADGSYKHSTANISKELTARFW
jgi:hypothetical protein